LAGGVIKENVEVGGSFRSSQPLKFSSIDVGGSVRLSGGTGGDIEVGGLLKSDGDLIFDEIDVGGKVEILGDASGQSIDVGGVIRVSRNLSLSGGLKVGGKAEIGETVKAKTIQVGGRLEAEKAEADEEIKTNTLITTSGAKAQRIEIGGRGEAQGPIIADTVLIRERSRVEDIYADSVTLRRGCRARNIYAARIDIESGCRISGEVRYTESLNAERDVTFASAPEKVEKLPVPPF